METTFKFSHTEDAIQDALGLSKETDDKCSEIIFFSTLSNHLMARELFDDIEEAPKALITKTGDLEKCLSLCSTELEKDYVLLMFNQIHDMAIESIAKHIVFEKMQGEDKRKLQLMMELMEIKIKEAAEKEKAGHFLPTEIFKKIDLVKKSRYNFEKYLQLVNNNVDDIINKSLSGEE
jgi:hypothetical protein